MCTRPRAGVRGADSDVFAAIGAALAAGARPLRGLPVEAATAEVPNEVPKRTPFY